MKSKERPNLRFKVISGFGILSAILIGVIFFSYLNFKKLFNSIEYLSKPAHQEEILNDIYQNVSLSLKNIRLYSLTADKKYFNLYQLKSTQIKDQVRQLRQKHYFNTHTSQLDSLEHLLELKDTLAAYLKEVIKKRDSLYLSLRDIKLQVDTVYYPAIAVETTQVNYLKVVPNIREEKIEKKSWLKRIFTGKDKSELEVRQGRISGLNFEEKARLKIDTSIEVKAVAYSSLKEVEKQLNVWEYNNRKIKNLITKEEKDLLHNNDAITLLIQQIIEDLKKKERLEKESNLQKASLVVQKSTYTILLIGVSGIAGCFVLLILISKDIRISNIYKSRLAREKKKAEKLAKVKEQFLSNMSHEIRTPLGAIIGFTEQLDRTPLRSEQKGYLAAIKASSDHLLSLVNDILDLSKIEAGKMAIEKVSFQISEIAREVYENLKLKAGEKGLQFNYTIDAALEKPLIGDSFRLKQILFNLIGNALKFTEGGYVEFSFRQLSYSNNMHLVQLQVRDSGIGIPEGKQEAIFKNFEQVSLSDSRKFGGTGLGLSISKNLLDLMGGTISVESKAGSGTIFTVILPFERDSNVMETEVQVEKNEEIFALSGKEILVVEDDPFIIELMQVIFSRHKVKATFTGSVKEGFDAFESKDYDLVITDMQLPDGKGTDLINTIRQQAGKKKEIPIVVCTAHVLDTQKQEDLVSVSFLTKPFKEQNLLRSIGNALEKQGNQEYDIKEDYSVKNEEKYSLQSIREIVNDEQEWKQLLQKIIANGKIAISDFNEALGAMDKKRIAKVAHKLIPTYTLFQSTEIVQKLVTLDKDQEEKSEDEITSIVHMLITMLNEVLNDLELKHLNESS